MRNVIAVVLGVWMALPVLAEMPKTVPSIDAMQVAEAPDFAAIRTGLLPQVQQTVNRVCGSDCPAFSILPVYKTGALSKAGGKLDDLGFDISETAMTKTLSGISIEVLTSDKLKPEIVQSIRNTVLAEARNYTDLPVQVRAKTVASTAGIGDGKAIGSKDLLDLAKTGIWPIAALLLALVGLGAIAAYFHQKRKTRLHAYELENADKLPQPAAEEVARKEIAAQADEVTEGRLEDLSRFLEECSYQKDFESLRKIVALFPGDTLSRKVQLAPVVPVMISKAMNEAGYSHIVGTKQTVEWLKGQLDLVHWKRLREQVEPMAKLSALSGEQLSQVFANVPSAKGKALVLSFIESQNWPTLMASLNSNQKVEVGGSLFQLQQVGVAADAITRKEVLDGLSQALSANANDKLLSEYILYLSEDETRELSKNLSSAPSFVRPKSVEQVLSSLSERQLLELVLGLDVDQIAVLVDKLPVETQQRVLTALPKKLKERIESRRSLAEQENDEQAQDSRWMQTRSRLLKLYSENHSSRSIH